MNIKLSLDLAVILRRQFVMPEDVESDVINEILELIKKRDAYVVGLDGNVNKSTIPSGQISLPASDFFAVLQRGFNDVRKEIRTRQEETL